MSEGNKDEINHELNESQPAYGAVSGKKIRIYKSFEEEAEAKAFEASQIHPVERLRLTVELILRMYGVTRDDLKKRKKSRHIKIIRHQ